MGTLQGKMGIYLGSILDSPVLGVALVCVGRNMNGKCGAEGPQQTETKESYVFGSESVEILESICHHL